MDKKYLPDLISELDQELLTPWLYQRQYDLLPQTLEPAKAYAEDRGEYYYTEQLGIDFVQEFFGITQDDFARILPQAENAGITRHPHGRRFSASSCSASALFEAQRNPFHTVLS